jgi:membrane protein
LLSLAPVIVIAVALAAMVYGRDAAEGRLASEIAGVAGPAAANTIQEISKAATNLAWAQWRQCLAWRS